MKRLILSLCGLAWAFSAQAQKLDDASVERLFNERKAELEGKERDCWTVNTFKGDLNGDKIPDLLVQYGCGFKGNMGNMSAGGGWAIWVSKGGKHVFLGKDEEISLKAGIPKKILPNGIIEAEKLDYGADDARCCPSIKTPTKVKLIDGKLVKQ